MTVNVEFSNNIKAQFVALGPNTSADVCIEVVGSNGVKTLTFRDTFDSFKASLSDFILGVMSGRALSPPAFNREVVKIIGYGVM